MTKKVGDLLGIGLFLVAIFILFESLNISNAFSDATGLLGAIIVIIVEAYFLYEKWIK